MNMSREKLYTSNITLPIRADSIKWNYNRISAKSPCSVDEIATFCNLL